MAWHDATCASLKLEWEDGRPGCLTCQRKAPALAPVHPISPPRPPPDVPRSQLVCTWPPQLFPGDISVRLYQDKEAQHVDAKFKDKSHITPAVLRVAKTSKRIPLTKPPNLSSIRSEEDGLSLKDNSQDADAATHNTATQDQNTEMLAFVRANIDEWTSSNFAQSQTTLDSTQQCPQGPNNQPSSTTSFQDIYTCLPNADSVRLLCLYGSATEDDPVHCTLLVCGLRDPSRPTFEAFSYTWADAQGDSSLSEAIYVGPQYDILPVTKNCLAALRCFRTNMDRLVWVDAICINQFDLEERGHQVSLMRDVYKSAARVLTYLGQWNAEVGDVITSPHYSNDKDFDNHSVTTPTARAILCLPYFSRIWVIQEVLLSKSATLSVGKHTMHWKDFRDLVRQRHPGQNRNPASVLVEHSNGREGDMSLLSWLQATKESRCGDLRDRVYGLMGVVSEKDRKNLPVDYSISKQQLYIGLATYWLTDEENVNVGLSKLLEMALLPKITPFLPSWTPDWTPQPHIDADEVRNSTIPLTLQMDTKCIGGPSSGLNWSKTFGRDEYAKLCLRWTLEFAFEPCASHAPIEPLPLGGTLALEAFHILSISTGKPNLLDTRRRPLWGMQLTHFENSEPRRRDRPDGDVHLFVSDDMQEALALRKHGSAVYSLSNRFRIVFAPSGILDPPRCRTIRDIHPSLKALETEIAVHWLMDLFFHAACAGSAYTIRHGVWPRTYPMASNACRSLDLALNTDIGEERRRSILVAMLVISQDAWNSIGETEVPWQTRNEANLDPGSSRQGRGDFKFGDEAKSDSLYAAGIQETYATKPRTALSPEDLCTHLRSVVKNCLDSCNDYRPLQSALSDLGQIGSEPLPSLPLPSHLWFTLMNDIIKVVGANVQPSQRSVDFAIAPIIYTARILVRGLRIDSGFTLEQNFNILWIQVLTMEMVARLRGCLQQRLILMTLQEKLMQPRRIYLI